MSQPQHSQPHNLEQYAYSQQSQHHPYTMSQSQEHKQPQQSAPQHQAFPNTAYNTFQNSSHTSQPSYSSASNSATSQNQSFQHMSSQASAHIQPQAQALPSRKSAQQSYSTQYNPQYNQFAQQQHQQRTQYSSHKHGLGPAPEPSDIGSSQASFANGSTLQSSTGSFMMSQTPAIGLGGSSDPRFSRDNLNNSFPMSVHYISDSSDGSRDVRDVNSRDSFDVKLEAKRMNNSQHTMTAEGNLSENSNRSAFLSSSNTTGKSFIIF